MMRNIISTIIISLWFAARVAFSLAHFTARWRCATQALATGVARLSLSLSLSHTHTLSRRGSHVRNSRVPSRRPQTQPSRRREHLQRFVNRTLSLAISPSARWRAQHRQSRPRLDRGGASAWRSTPPSAGEEVRHASRARACSDDARARSTQQAASNRRACCCSVWCKCAFSLGLVPRFVALGVDLELDEQLA